MTDYLDQFTNELNLLRTLPGDGGSDQVEELWNQIMLNRALDDPQISQAKARRSEAEQAREQVSLDTASAAKLLCDGMKSEATKKLEEAETARAQVERERQQVETELGRAKETRAEAERARERMLAEAEEKAQKIVDKARTATQEEVSELKRRALEEIKGIMARVDSIRVAAAAAAAAEEEEEEELETQRILTNIAKLKATSTSALAEIAGQNDDWPALDGEEPGADSADLTEMLASLATAREAAPTMPESGLEPVSSREPETTALEPVTANGSKPKGAAKSKGRRQSGRN